MGPSRLEKGYAQCGENHALTCGFSFEKDSTNMGRHGERKIRSDKVQVTDLVMTVRLERRA